jgi:hypothetical protein
MEGRDMHRALTTLFSVVLMGLGVLMIVRTLAAGGGPAAVGLLLGGLFVAAGAGRLWVSRRRP